MDITQNQTSQTHRANVSFVGSAVIPVNEYVTITLPTGITGSGKVLGYQQDGTDTVLSLGVLTFDDGIYHKLTNSTTLTGQTSEIVATVNSVIGLGDGDEALFENDIAAPNSSFETIGNSYIDFSESNPFGEPFT